MLASGAERRGEVAATESFLIFRVSENCPAETSDFSSTAACPCRRVNPAFSERLSTVRGPISHAIMGAQEDTQAGSADPARAPESYGTAAKDVAGPRAPAVTCVAAAVRCFAPFSFMLLASVLCSRGNGHLRAYASTCRCARPRAPRPSPSRADD